MKLALFPGCPIFQTGWETRLLPALSRRVYSNFMEGTKTVLVYVQKSGSHHSVFNLCPLHKPTPQSVAA